MPIASVRFTPGPHGQYPSNADLTEVRWVKESVGVKITPNFSFASG